MTDDLSGYLKRLKQLSDGIKSLSDFDLSDGKLFILENELINNFNLLFDYANNLKESALIKIDKDLSPCERLLNNYYEKLCSVNVQSIINRHKWAHLKFYVDVNDDEAILYCVEPPNNNPILFDDCKEYFNPLLAELGIEKIDFRRVTNRF